MAAYLFDGRYRRQELVASLVNPNNGYSRLRLAHYGSADGEDWDHLPEWNPDAIPVHWDSIGDAAPGRSGEMTGGMTATGATPLPLPSSPDALSATDWLALGKAAFERYPAQVATYLEVAVVSRASAGRYGLWQGDGSAAVGGLVRARMADGTGALALTCSSCHTGRGQGGVLTPGLPNAELDLGAAVIDGAGLPLEASQREALARWGPGRLDVTTTTGAEPVRIPDLRPLRELGYLQQDATLRVHGASLATLAIRIETLLVTSSGNSVRPPRIVVWALAVYVASLADSLPRVDPTAAAAPAGARLFAATCSPCHAPPSFTGPPVPLAVVGTDPAFGESPSRGTGLYRVPSLRGVGERVALFHDGSIPSLEELLDGDRLLPSFGGGLHGPGPVPGHVYGLALRQGDRAALVMFLRSL